MQSIQPSLTRHSALAVETHLDTLAWCKLLMLGLSGGGTGVPGSCEVVPPGCAPGVSGCPAFCPAAPDVVSGSVVSVSSGTEGEVEGAAAPVVSIVGGRLVGFRPCKFRADKSEKDECCDACKRESLAITTAWKGRTSYCYQ